MSALPWLSVVSTGKRRQYLRGTLEAIDGAGGASFPGRRVVFVDGYADVARAACARGWEAERLTDPKDDGGPHPTLWRVLHRAARASAPYLLFFEDDVRLSRNAVWFMAALEVPQKFGFLSFLQMRDGMASTPGIHELPPGLPFWGNQALKIPARSLARFFKLASMPRDLSSQKGSDVWIGEELAPGIVLPAIVRHIGAVSSIPRDELETLEGRYSHRAGLNYAGDHADALELFGGRR